MLKENVTRASSRGLVIVFFFKHTCLLNYLVESEIKIFARIFILCVLEAKALARQCICAGSSELSLLTQ